MGASDIQSKYLNMVSVAIFSYVGCKSWSELFAKTDLAFSFDFLGSKTLIFEFPASLLVSGPIFSDQSDNL